MYSNQIVETSILFKKYTEWDIFTWSMSTPNNLDIRCPFNKSLNTADSFFQGVIYNGKKSESRGCQST